MVCLSPKGWQHPPPRKCMLGARQQRRMQPTPRHPTRTPGAEAANGQMAQALTQTFTTANSSAQAKAVASAVGGAIESMAGSAQTAMMVDALTAINDVADNGQCGQAAATAFGAQNKGQGELRAGGMLADVMRRNGAPGSCCRARLLYLN
jgi:hypothetical protein